MLENIIGNIGSAQFAEGKAGGTLCKMYHEGNPTHGYLYKSKGHCHHLVPIIHMQSITMLLHTEWHGVHKLFLPFPAAICLK